MRRIKAAHEGALAEDSAAARAEAKAEREAAAAEAAEAAAALAEAEEEAGGLRLRCLALEGRLGAREVEEQR